MLTNTRVLRTRMLPGLPRGILLTELIGALFVIVLIMVLLTEAFSAGLRALRELKDVGDMSESLQRDAARLEADLRLANELAVELIIHARETGEVHRSDATALRVLYEDLGNSIADVEQGLTDFAAQI